MSIVWFGVMYKFSLNVLLSIIHKYVILLSVKRRNEGKILVKIWLVFQLKQN